MTTGTLSQLPKLQTGDALIDETFARSIVPVRPFGSHKWGVGGLVIVAGAPGFVGAPALAAMAAGRSGAGVVSVAVPRQAISVVASLVPEAVYLPLPDGDASNAPRKVIDAISAKLDKSTAMVIGPGLGEDDYAASLLGALFGLGAGRPASTVGFLSPATPPPTAVSRLAGSEKPAIVDADALNWLAKQTDWWEPLRPGSLVLTPHIGEMSRLLECSADDIIADPVETARSASGKWRQVVVLKYGHTVVTDGKQALVSDDAPASLATAGSGDVLAGSIGAFLAQGVEPLPAAALAVFVGCRAARRVERRTGTLGLVASDLPMAIAEELAALEVEKGVDNG